MLFGILDALVTRIVRRTHTGKLTHHSPSMPTDEERDEGLRCGTRLPYPEYRRLSFTFPFSSVPHQKTESKISIITPLVLQSCAVYRLHRFEQEGSTSDLEASIRYFERAENLAAPAVQPQLFRNYKDVVALLARFGQKGDVADLNSAVTRLKELQESQPTDHPMRPLTFKTLAQALRLRSDKTGDSQDLDDAIRYEQRVLYICPPK